VLILDDGKMKNFARGLFGGEYFNCGYLRFCFGVFRRELLPILSKAEKGIFLNNVKERCLWLCGGRFLDCCGVTDSALCSRRKPFVPEGTSKWCLVPIPRVLGDWTGFTTAYALKAAVFDRKA